MEGNQIGKQFEHADRLRVVEASWPWINGTQRAEELTVGTMDRHRRIALNPVILAMAARSFGSSFPSQRVRRVADERLADNLVFAHQRRLASDAAANGPLPPRRGLSEKPCRLGALRPVQNGTRPT
jgi:hypothetical protein